MTELLWTDVRKLSEVRQDLTPPAQAILDSWQRESFLDLTDRRVPLLLSASHRIIESASAYLYYVAVVSGKSESPKTASTYAEGLKCWFDYLHQCDLSWDEVDEELVAQFRNMLKKRKSVRSRNTLIARVGVVYRFYRWLVRTGRLDVMPFPDDGSLLPKRYESFPHPLNREQLSAVITKCRAPYGLMVKWMVATGLRRFEVCALTPSHIARNTELDSRFDHLVYLRLIRKGGKRHRLMVPLGLIDETTWYLSTDRLVSLKRARKEERAINSSKHLFLNQFGRPVSPNQLGRVFRRVVKSLGIDATSHDLRHTFAVCMLDLLERLASEGVPINPFKTLQTLLNHSSVHSTEIYVRARDVYSKEVKGALTYLYGEMP